MQVGYSLPGSDEPLTHARIAHAGNWLANGAAVASDTDAAYFADGPLNSLTYEKWSPFANVLAAPEDFEDAEWAKTGVTVSGALVTENTSTGQHKVQDSAISFTAVAHTLSVDVKASGRHEIRLIAQDGVTTFAAYFDLNDMSVGTAVNATGSIKHLGGGKYRCSIAFTPASGTGNVQILLSNGSETTSYTGDGVSGVNLYEAWLSEAAATWEYAHTKSSSCDYICIGAHTLGSDGATFKVQYHNGSTWADLCAAQSPTDDSPIYAIFAPVTASRFRLNISSFAKSPKVGIFKAGLSLQMERPIYGGHVPLVMSRQTTLRSNYSETGEFLGRTKQRVQLTSSFSWQHLSATWVRANWPGFQTAIETEPFFIAWRPGTFTDAGLCQVDATPAPTNMGIRDLMSVDVEVRGYGHD